MKSGTLKHLVFPCPVAWHRPTRPTEGRTYATAWKNVPIQRPGFKRQRKSQTTSDNSPIRVHRERSDKLDLPHGFDRRCSPTSVIATHTFRIGLSRRHTALLSCSVSISTFTHAISHYPSATATLISSSLAIPNPVPPSHCPLRH